MKVIKATVIRVSNEKRVYIKWRCNPLEWILTGKRFVSHLYHYGPRGWESENNHVVDADSRELREIVAALEAGKRQKLEELVPILSDVAGCRV